MQQRSPKKDAAAKDCRGVRRSKRNYTKLFDDVNRFFDVVVRFVDVFESSLLETLGEGVVFFLGYIVVSLINEFECTVETTAPIEARVNGWMIVQVLAVVDGSLLDFVDGGVDFPDGFVVVVTDGSPCPVVAEIVAGGAEVAERVEVVRVRAGDFLCVHGCQWSGGEKAECEEDAVCF